MMKQKGFTLIELVVVITILGILAAFALPRFADFKSEARASVINGLAGSMESAAALAHAKVLVGASSNPATITMEGTSIDMVNGYPANTSTGIGAATNISATGGLSCSGTGPYTCSYSTTCKVDYSEPASLGSSPTITATVTNCD